MGVYQKIKRAFSFKKDKKSKDRSKSESFDQLETSDSIGKNLPELYDGKGDTLRKDAKKRSMSLRSIVRKASFGKKDVKKQKKNDVASTYAHHDTTATEPAYLNDIVKPVAAVPAVAEPPATKPDEVKQVVQETPQTAPLEPKQTSVEQMEKEVNDLTRKSETNTEGFVEITAELIKEIEEYDKMLAAEGKTVRVNEITPEAPKPDDVKTPESKPEQIEHPEPHTITDVINLLADKPEKSSVNETDHPKAEEAPLKPECSAVDEAIESLKVTAEKQYESRNGFVTNGKPLATTAQPEKPSAFPPSKTKEGLRQEGRVKLWRGAWIAAFVVMASIVVAAMVARRSLI